jgi:hypothetical protein
LNCEQILDGLPNPCLSVLPITLYKKPSTFREWITNYKTNDHPEHVAYSTSIGAILSAFFQVHSDALASFTKGFDAICVVPSCERPPPHPLTAVFDQFVTAARDLRRDLLVRGPGMLGHGLFSNDAYIPAGKLTPGLRVLLLDDVYTTGAAAQSAASALQSSGLIVPAILVIARRYNLEFHPSVEALWARQEALGYSLDDSPFWKKS